MLSLVARLSEIGKLPRRESFAQELFQFVPPASTPATSVRPTQKNGPQFQRAGFREPLPKFLQAAFQAGSSVRRTDWPLWEYAVPVNPKSYGRLCRFHSAAAISAAQTPLESCSQVALS